MLRHYMQVLKRQFEFRVGNKTSVFIISYLFKKHKLQINRTGIINTRLGIIHTQKLREVIFKI